MILYTMKTSVKYDEFITAKSVPDVVNSIVC